MSFRRHLLWKMLRGCVAVSAAYALVLQVLLGAVLVSRTATAEPLVICFSTDVGAPADHGTPGKPAPHDHCVLCTVANGSHAILSGESFVAAPIIVVSAVELFRSLERISFDDPRTGHYQRGPPTRVIA
jgi:hypothetical protein